MKCPICNALIKDLDFDVLKEYLFATREGKDIHIHGDTGNKSLMRELIQESVVRSKLESSFTKSSNLLDLKEIIFHNRQRIGDILVFTCAVRDFKKVFPNIKVNVISTAMHIWDNNPNIDSSVKPYYKNGKKIEDITTEDLFSGNTNVLKIGPGWLTNASNRLDWHFTNAYRISMQDHLNIHIQQGESRPDIWFTEEEYNSPRITEKPYWIIVVGGEKGWGCKMYPFDRWQTFVDQNSDTTFVQLGAAGDKHQKLQGSNVIDMIGQTEDKNTGVRDLFKLFLNAEGSIGLVSFHMHLSGALYKPSIVIAGAREPVSFTRYPGHQYLANDGCLPCSINACWHCNIVTCPNLIKNGGELDKDILDKVLGDKKLNDEEKKIFENATKSWMPRCVDLIQPEDLTRALNNYYLGGRLKKGIFSEKPLLKNIIKSPSTSKIVVKEAIKPIITEKSDTIPQTLNPQFNMAWGGTSIFEEDWMFMKKIIDDHKVKTILEFGAGLSTLILNEMGYKVVTYENNPDWIDAVKKMNPKCDIRPWDGKECDVTGYFDMAFVDGPRAYSHFITGRQYSTKVASKFSDIVIMHDATRPGEQLWIKTYITSDFDLAYVGGKWDYVQCWIRKKPVKTCIDTPSKETTTTKIVSPTRDWKSIKVISTARGWGGCARSVTTIMKFLSNSGHQVEFIPFRNKVSSVEYIDFLRKHPGIKVTENYSTIMEKCDIVFMYVDDYVWEFEKVDIVNAFSSLNADKKIMMLNYRRGKAGEIAWTKNWDKYMFLNSNQEKEFLKILPGSRTKVLPPCTELESFLNVKPVYDKNLRVVRHSSQGDTKFCSDLYPREMAIKLVQDALDSRPDITVEMLPGPSFMTSSERFTKHGRTASIDGIANFLSGGNLFWYSLPMGYPDQGPRVVLEAMAAGLPILADNWGGAVDRVTPECGWLCDTKEQMIEIIKNVTVKELEEKGKAAKIRALSEFVPEKWIQEILDV